MDVKTTLLNGDLEKVIYIEQPNDSHKVTYILCVSFTSHYMVWNNPQELGTKC
jgi:hypothetical protein